MDSAGTKSNRRNLAGFVLPMFAFVLFLGIDAGLSKRGDSLWLSSPEYWIYPAQTIVCGVLLVWYRSEYPLFIPERILFAIAIAFVVFIVWIAPRAILDFAPRQDGFNPEVVRDQSLIYWGTIVLRFVRLVVVVPLVEEIFFRGFLLRYFVREEFNAVPIGTFSWLSFSLVTLGFGLVHSPSDWIGGLVAGGLYNGVAYRTRSLSSCVLAHAITNLLLGLWIMGTHEWGYW